MRKRKDGPSRRELLAIIRRLEARNAELEKRIGVLETELATARKNSTTSSKPPSSDIVKPPKSPPTGSQVTRRLRLRRAHGLSKKVPRTHRYLLTEKGRALVVALNAARNVSPRKLAELAA